MQVLQPGEVFYAEPGKFVPIGRPALAEKVRLDALRLECLKLACRDEPTSLPDTSATGQSISIAREMFEFVTDAPKQPELFAVRRLDAGDAPDDLGPRDYLNISGSLVSWDFESHAYRFRSKAEAKAAIACRVEGGFGIGGAAIIVSLPSYYDPF